MNKTTKKVSVKKPNLTEKEIAGGTTTGTYLLLVGIILLTIIVYSNSITKIFIALDDQVYIQDNPFIKSLSWNSIRDIFTSFYNGNYHPFTTLLYAIEYSWFGEHASFFHSVSLIIHLVNTCLVFLLFQNLSGRKEIAILGAALFAIHPMHVESVVWISEQKDVLYSFFYILGLNCYVNYIKNRKSSDLVKTLLLFLFSLLSKSAAVTFPLVLFCIDFLFNRKWDRKIILEKIPFFLLSLLFGILAVLSQQAAGAINDETMVPYSLFERIFVVSYAVIYYIVKLIIPYDLCVLHYAPKQIPFYFYLCPVVIIGLGIIAYKAKQFRRVLIFGLLFYFFSILLVIQIIPLGYVIVSERYSYIPYLGLFFIIGYLFVYLKDSKDLHLKKLKPYLNYAAALALIIFSYVTFEYIGKWQSSVILFSDIVKKNPESAYAHFTNGKIQNVNGNPDGALISFERSMQLDSTISEAYFCRANIYFARKRYDEAIRDYKKAETLKPAYAENANNLAFLYSEIGKMDESIEYYSKAIAVKPTEYLYQRRATCYTLVKKYDEALKDYQKTIDMNPNLPEPYFNRGVCYYYTGQLSKACDDWKRSSSMGYPTAKEYAEKYCSH